MLALPRKQRSNLVTTIHCFAARHSSRSVAMKGIATNKRDRNHSLTFSVFDCEKDVSQNTKESKLQVPGGSR